MIVSIEIRRESIKFNDHRYCYGLIFFSSLFIQTPEYKQLRTKYEAICVVVKRCQDIIQKQQNEKKDLEKKLEETQSSQQSSRIKETDRVISVYFYYCSLLQEGIISNVKTSTITSISVFGFILAFVIGFVLGQFASRFMKQLVFLRIFVCLTNVFLFPFYAIPCTNSLLPPFYVYNNCFPFVTSFLCSFGFLLIHINKCE